MFAGEAAFFVVNAEPEVEAAQEFDEPLVGEGFGDEDEDAAGFADGEQALQDEAGFDGFAETDFIGEEYAGDLARGDFVEDVDLVRDEFEASAEVAAHVGLAEAGLCLECAQAQVKNFSGLDLAGEEAFGRGTDAGDVGEFVFADAAGGMGGAGGGEVNEEAGGLRVFFDGFDVEGGAVAGGEGVAGVESHAFEHGGAEGVEAAFAGGGVTDSNAALRAVHARDESKAKLWLALTHATLSDLSNGFRHAAHVAEGGGVFKEFFTYFLILR